MFLVDSGDIDIVSHPMGNFKEFCNLTCEKLHIIAIFHGYIDAFDGLAAQKTANSFYYRYSVPFGDALARRADSHLRTLFAALECEPLCVFDFFCAILTITQKVRSHTDTKKKGLRPCGGLSFWCR